jgi:5-methylcytosine-specific restriction protein A
MKLKTLKPRIANVDTSIARSQPMGTPRIRGRALMVRNNRLSMRKPLCVECEKVDVVRVGTQWDHIIPLWEGGADHESNMQHLCDECHEIKTTEEAKRRAGR